MRARQVLINIGTESDAGPPEEFAMGSITALKQKLKDALSRCGDRTETMNHRIKAVTWLRNGGILMELGSDEVTKWWNGSQAQISGRNTSQECTLMQLSRLGITT